MPDEYLSFKLADSFIEQYEDREVDWGFGIGAGNFLGEVTFYTKYSRKKEDGSKERWYECVRRCIEGMYSIQKDFAAHQRIPWNHNKAQHSAQEAYDLMFKGVWTPPGRGLEHMGTELIFDMGSAPLQNCSFISTEHLGPRNPVEPFVLLMEMSMLGIGVGFDTKGAGKLEVYKPLDEVEVHVVEDSREGWVKSYEVQLLSYFTPNQKTVEFDTSGIRDKGAIIKRFGGTAPGPGPLIGLHKNVRMILDRYVGKLIDARLITDLNNMSGYCVVSGGRRRTAEIAFGDLDDKEFLNLKNWEVETERMADKTGWGHISNNSVFANIGDDINHLIDPIRMNGEPGIMYLDLARTYGRLGQPADNKDMLVAGANPCVEQQLESYEACTLVETFPHRAEDFSQYKRALKYAFLYAKTVTLLPTHWPKVNEVMQRNRRIGTSMTGVFQFAEHNGWQVLRTWCDEGAKVVEHYDDIYSRWLGIRESIRMCSVKPSGTTSLLFGATPGVHAPVASGDYLRLMRETYDSPVMQMMLDAGYYIEPDVKDPNNTVCIYFPTTGPEVRSERDVPLFEQMALAALLQRHWADNMVSATFKFTPEEETQIGSALRAFEGQLKCMSFLPLGEKLSAGAYPQMPYQEVDPEEFEKMRSKVQPIDWDKWYAQGNDAQGDKFCSNDTCEIPQ